MPHIPPRQLLPSVKSNYQRKCRRNVKRHLQTPPVFIRTRLPCATRDSLLLRGGAALFNFRRQIGIRQNRAPMQSRTPLASHGPCFDLLLFPICSPFCSAAQRVFPAAPVSTCF